MLLELNVTNFAIINNVTIHFQSGLNILSGETGAGKSVLLKSLALLMGEKSSAESVRSGANEAVIEGLFDVHNRPDIRQRLLEQGLEADQEHLVVRRIVSAQGKSKIYINGRMATLGALQTVVSPLIEVAGQITPLIEMTGQHENQSLLSKSYHLQMVDLFAGCYDLREEFRTDFEKYKMVGDEIQSIESEQRIREQRLDFLKYQRDEIKALSLKPGDENSLNSEYEKIKNSSRLTEWAQQAEQALLGDDESAIVRLHRVIQKGGELRRYDSELENRLKLLTEAKSAIEEFVYELRGYSAELENADSLDQIEEKISELRKIQKKYGESSAEILGALEEMEKEIHTLEHSDEKLSELKKQQLALMSKMTTAAEKLHKKRKTSAEKLHQAVNEELKDLNMKGVEFSVKLIQLEEFNSTGSTEAEFMIKPSPKDIERPISKIASGGELSRILLSLKSVIGLGGLPRSYLFDEVDTGVSGPTAEKVGRKLKAIANGQQVICVTHLPQVASFADHHYFIQKSQNKNGVGMQVNELKKDERINEIARLISGEKITKTSIAHAKELLNAH